MPFSASPLRCLLLAGALLLAAGPARAITLSIAPDQATYGVGETVTLSVLLDLEGTPAQVFDGRIEFDAALATGLDVTTSLDEQVGIPPFPDCGPGYCDVFDHSLPAPVFGLVTATVTLSADAPGEVDVVWNPAPLGIVGAPGTSFTIVPEPGAAGLVAMGLAGLAGHARRRRAAQPRARDQLAVRRRLFPRQHLGSRP